LTQRTLRDVLHESMEKAMPASTKPPPCIHATPYARPNCHVQYRQCQHPATKGLVIRAIDCKNCPPSRREAPKKRKATAAPNVAVRQPVIIKSGFRLGDMVLLSGAVRDLAGLGYEVSVDTIYPDLWENNPYVVPVPQDRSKATEIELTANGINEWRDLREHYAHYWHQEIGGKLGIHIPRGPMHGDIHLSGQEKGWIDQVSEATGQTRPFWLVASGGTKDYTVKWPHVDNLHRAIKSVNGHMRFVQIGSEEDHHPVLEGCVNLIGKTTVRQLIRLVYHSEGVICPVTGPMHLAAAVPTKTGEPRPCIVLAGGREPAYWEEYPGHDYLSTVGKLDCCKDDGCWLARCEKANDGRSWDHDSLCTHGVETDYGLVPRCQSMITPSWIAGRLLSHIGGEALGYV